MPVSIATWSSRSNSARWPTLSRRFELAAQFRPDAIVLDIGLPRQNGYEAARAIRLIAGLERVPIIALTGYGQDVDRERSRDAGIDRHLVKPIELGALADTVEAIRAGA